MSTQTAHAQTNGELDTSFSGTVKGANGPVYSVVVQPDNKILIGGSFGTLDSMPQRAIGRLHPDGTRDATFANSISGTGRTAQVTNHALAVQPDGKIVMAGSNPDTRGAGLDGRVARVNPDGTPDSTFVKPLLRAPSEVFAVALQPDGKIIIGGKFYWGVDAIYNDFVRMYPNGSLDTSFSQQPTNVRGTIYSIAVQPDGKVLVGGVLSVKTPEGYLYVNIARVNSDGSVDSSFPLQAMGRINQITVQPDGKIIIAGLFAEINGKPRGNIARLNADGSLDDSFGEGLSGTNTEVTEAILQADGKILIGGKFASVNSSPAAYLARLNSNGSLDTSFSTPTFSSTTTPNIIHTIAVRTDGKIIIGGVFHKIGQVNRWNTAMLNSDGTLASELDTSFKGANFTVHVVVPDADGKFLIGGGFIQVDNEKRNYIARLNPDGLVDTSFEPASAITGMVQTIARQTDGKIIVGTYDTPVIRRLNPNGSVDASFEVNLTYGDTGQRPGVSMLAIQADGKILVGGKFTTINGVARNNIARLNPDGSVDTSFTTTANSTVTAFQLQPDGKILLGGYFTTVNDVPHVGIARLESSGANDESFTAQISSSSGALIKALVVQPDGKILVGGNFQEVNNQNIFNLTRLNSDGSTDSTFEHILSIPDSGVNVSTVNSLILQSDGSIVVGGTYVLSTVSADKFAVFQLKPDGTLYGKFTLLVSPSPSYAVNSMVQQPDGKLVIGGAFARLHEINRNYFARLHFSQNNANLFLTSTPNPAKLDQTITFSLTTALTATGNVTLTKGVEVLAVTALNNGTVIFNIPAATLGSGSHTIQAVYSGDANFAASTSNMLLQNVSATNPFEVTLGTDNGKGDTPGTFSFALATANSSAYMTVPVTIVFALSGGSTINFSDKLIPTGRAGLTILGKADCASNQPLLTLNGPGVNGDGLQLTDNTILQGVLITGFNGRQLSIIGKGNRLYCVRVVR